MRGSVTRVLKRRRRKRVRDATCQKLLEDVWSIYSDEEHIFGSRIDAYLDHYQNLTVQASTLNAFNDGKNVTALVEVVRASAQKPVSEVLAAIVTASENWHRSPFSHDRALQALQLATRLWLFSNPELDPLIQPLDKANQQLHGASPSSTTTGLLCSDFSAKSLTRKGGFYLVWTSDLSEHLTFASKDQLRVFRHAHILQQYQYGREESLYPPNFLSETYQTVHLLFPFEDYATCKRVKRIARTEQVDIEASSASVSATEKAMIEHDMFQLSSYRFYGARLAEIQRRYDLARPHRLTQWWYDRRQRPEWAALMIALVVFLLTVLFGIAQTVTGILQIVLSSH